MRRRRRKTAAPRKNGDGPARWAGVMALVVSVVAVLSIHEIGHMAAALMLGVPVESISVGFPVTPVAWDVMVAGYPVLVRMIPFGFGVSVGSLTAAQDLVLSLTGPLVSVLAGLLVAWGVIGGVQAYRMHAQVVSVLMRVLGSPSDTIRNIAGVRFFANVSGECLALGLRGFIAFIGGLSIVTGYFNLLPIPPLDGARVVFAGLSLFGVEVPDLVKSLLFLLGGVLMIGLFVVASVRERRA